jgi:aminopeptidase N
MAHPERPDSYIEINNFYTTTVYEKGSEVTRMFATLLGKDGFKKGMDLYFERHDGDAATIEDFVKCFEDANGVDLAQFSLWYNQAGTPLVSVSSAYDQGKGEFTLSLEQMIPPTPGQSVKEPMHIPLRFGLLLADGSEANPAAVSGAEVTGDVLHLTERRQTVTFSGIASRPVVSLNRGFSAPVNLHFEQAAADLAHIARHDGDLFARWQALNDLALPTLVDAARKARAGAPVETSDVLADTLIAIAADESLEPAFRAQALALPSESDIARELGSNNDPDAIRTGREAVLAFVANRDPAVFAALFSGHHTEGAFTPDASGAGHRALRNAALAYLAVSDGTPARAAEAFASADNMTDLSAALTVLAHRFPDAPETAEALEAFRARFADNALVIDKWFSIQSTIPGDGALERVKGLMQSPLFNKANPNRVRALVGTFAFSNPTGFNRADGAGYRFLADQILEIDPKNPQLAARILTSMRSWRALEEVRSDHARNALRAIAAGEKLSSDVSDIVERMLKA